MAIQNLLLQPASGLIPRRHLRTTVDPPLELDGLFDTGLLSAKEREAISHLAEHEKIRMWGFEPGKIGLGLNNWRKLRTGDLILFYQNKMFFKRSTLLHKIHNKELARHYWKINSKTNQTWEYIYFFY